MAAIDKIYGTDEEYREGTYILNSTNAFWLCQVYKSQRKLVAYDFREVSKMMQKSDMERIRELEGQVDELKNVITGLMRGTASFVYYEGDLPHDHPDAGPDWVAYDHRTGLRHTGLASWEEARDLITDGDFDLEVTYGAEDED